MALPEHILIVYGYLLLFVWVLVEQLGIPLPATPVLLSAGALSAEHELSFLASFASALGAALLADTVWFLVGRRYGHLVMRLLCKLSLEPTTCLRKTEDSYGRSGTKVLLFAKFIPGIATLAPPVAGRSGMSFVRFLIFDGIGGALWVGALLGGGFCFGDLLEHDPTLLDRVGHFSGILLGLGIVGFLVARIIRKIVVVRRFIRNRLEPVELKRWMDSGDEVFIIDLRHPKELEPEPYTLPGARLISPKTLNEQHKQIPRDRDVVVFCSCPSEATAAQTALKLHKFGIERVRPLRGGYDAWKAMGYPVDEVAPVRDEALVTISANPDVAPSPAL